MDSIQNDANFMQMQNQEDFVNIKTTQKNKIDSKETIPNENEKAVFDKYETENQQVFQNENTSIKVLLNTRLIQEINRKREENIEKEKLEKEKEEEKPTEENKDANFKLSFNYKRAIKAYNSS